MSRSPGSPDFSSPAVSREEALRRADERARRMEKKQAAVRQDEANNLPVVASAASENVRRSQASPGEPTQPTSRNDTSEEYRAGVLAALGAIQGSVARTKQRGLSYRTFFMGFFNIALTSFLIGRVPQHYWVLHTIKATSLYITAVKLKMQRHELFYLFDFCWVVNFLLVIVSLLLALEAVEDVMWVALPIDFFKNTVLEFVRQPLFGRTTFVLACGPIAAYCFTLGPPLILHDVLNFTNFFLHFTPILLMWTLRWHPLEVTAAWPGCFTQYHDPSDDPAGYWDVAHMACCGYFCWWVPFTLWMLLHGRFQGFNGNHEGNDTVYHNLLRGMPPLCGLLGVCPPSKSEAKYKADAATVAPVLKYMLIHMIGVGLAILIGTMCYFYFWFHTALVGVCFSVPAYNGSVAYVRLITRYPIKAVEDLAKETEAKKMN